MDAHEIPYISHTVRISADRSVGGNDRRTCRVCDQVTEQRTRDMGGGGAEYVPVAAAVPGSCASARCRGLCAAGDHRAPSVSDPGRCPCRASQQPKPGTAKTPLDDRREVYLFIRARRFEKGWASV